jgi:hypothetical protein
MEKAFDVKVLAEKLKVRGLDVAEEAAKILVEEVLAWTEESVKLTENKFDDMLLVVLPQVKSYALAQVDKIDGKEG